MRLRKMSPPGTQRPCGRALGRTGAQIGDSLNHRFPVLLLLDVRFRGQSGKTEPFRFRPRSRTTATSILPSLNVKTARSWRGIVPYAPRTGGAYDGHHRTAGIAGRARRRNGGVAARGARAAVGDVGGRVFKLRIARV